MRQDQSNRDEPSGRERAWFDHASEPLKGFADTPPSDRQRPRLARRPTSWLLSRTRAAAQAGLRGAGRLGFKARALGADYWPRSLRRPYLRLTLAAALAPLAPLLATALLAFGVYWSDEGSLASAATMTAETALQVAPTLYLMTVAAGAPVFAALWSLRLRRRTAFAAAGALVGTMAALTTLIAGGELTPVVWFYLSGAGALAFLALRWISGVRKNCSDPA